MINQNMRRVLGIGLAASLLAGATTALGQRALAQDTKNPTAQEGAQQGQPRRPRQPGQPGQPGGGGDFQGGPGGGFGGPGGGGPGGGFGPPPGMMGGGGGASMTATATAVYILRGNQLLAYDARTLSLLKSVELPRPQMGPGGEGFGGPGGPGGPGGRPQRPGGEN